MLRPSEFQLLESTTRQSAVGNPRKKHKPFQSIRHVDMGDDHMYGLFNADSVRYGPKDSHNTALMVNMKLAQVLRHATLNNRNAGDATRHMGDRAYQDNRVFRSYRDYYEGTGVWTGTKFDDVVMRLDADADLNALSTDDFQHGGTQKDEKKSTMVGVGGAVPVDNLDGTNLNNAYGLHYSVNIKPGKEVGANLNPADSFASTSSPMAMANM